MNKKILFLINPASGTDNKARLEATILRFCKERKLEAEIIPTNAEGDYTELKERIETEQIQKLVVVGGDGTVNQVAAALRGVNISIGIIPRGSGNGLAFAAGIPKDINACLKIIEQGKADYIDAFEINGQFSCMLSGLGFDAQVAHDFAGRQQRGLSNYIKVSAANFFKAPVYPFQIHTNEGRIDTEAFFISIANSNQFGNHFTIAPRASLSDGLLDVVVVPRMNKWQLVLSVLYHIRFGQVKPAALTKKRILYFQTRQLTITNSGLAPLHIDGEPRKSAEILSIQLVANAFRLIFP